MCVRRLLLLLSLLLSKREQIILEQMREIYINCTNICILIQQYTNRRINKDRFKAAYYTLFTIKGNHIAWDFEG